MRRVALLLSLLAAMAGCAHAVQQDARVAVRRRAGPADQAVAIFHNALVCSFTLRDASGALHDSEERRGGLLPIDMSRGVLDRAWWVQSSSSGALLVTVIAMPPGRYELVGYAEAKGWQEATDEKGRALGVTNCPHRWRLDHHQVQLPFEVRPGEVALLHVPTGTPPGPFFWHMRWMFDQIYDRDARDVVQSWKPAILRAEEESRAAFLARIKQARGGYDVYPLCDGEGMAGVVRTEGTPFPWYGNYQHDALESFRRRVPVQATAASGFGGGCVDKRGAFKIYLVGRDELDAAVRAAGEWLARENLQGEVDVTVTGPFVQIDRSAKD